MLDQFLFGLHDREVQLKLFDIGPTVTINQAISTARTARTWQTSKLLVEQLTTGASIQGIKPKSTYQKQKSAKVTTGAAAATKADTPTKPTGATCDKCGLEIRPAGHYCPARNATCRKCNATGHFKAVCNAKAKMAAIFVNQVSHTTQTPAQLSTPSHRPSTTANFTTYQSTPVYTPRPQPAPTSSHSGPSKPRSTGKPTTDRPTHPVNRPRLGKPETTSLIKDNAAEIGNDPHRLPEHPCTTSLNHTTI